MKRLLVLVASILLSAQAGAAIVISNCTEGGGTPTQIAKVRCHVSNNNPNDADTWTRVFLSCHRQTPQPAQTPMYSPIYWLVSGQQLTWMEELNSCQNVEHQWKGYVEAIRKWTMLTDYMEGPQAYWNAPECGSDN